MGKKKPVGTFSDRINTKNKHYLTNTILSKFEYDEFNFNCSSITLQRWIKKPLQSITFF